LLNSDFLEGFDDIAFLDVVAVGKANTALEVGSNPSIEALQGRRRGSYYQLRCSSQG
jgi:hypothetical protein